MEHMDRKTAEGILDEMMGVDDKPKCSRCAALKAERDLLRAVKDASYVLTGCSQANDYAPAFARLVDALDEWAGREI